MDIADKQSDQHALLNCSTSPPSPAQNRANVRGREDVVLSNPVNIAKRISVVDTMAIESESSIVVQISEASRNVGRAGDLAAYGVVYGEDPSLNCCDIVPANLPQTSQAAYLSATDSDYLVNGICVDMGRWKQSGYRNERGLFIQNRKLFRQLESLIARLLAKGMKVSFWQIRWEENKQAETLAIEVLDMAETVLEKQLG